MGERRPGPDALTYPWGDESGTTYNAPALTGNYNCNAVCAAYEPAYHGSESATYTATGGYTTPVTAYPGGAGTDGVLDLCRNCWEWTTSVITATHGGEMGQQVNAVRGGSWYANLNSRTAVYRGEGRDPSGRYSTVGLRVAATGQTSG